MNDGLMIIAFFIGYLIGAAYTNGYIGGIREDMDGVGDVGLVAFWPLYAIFAAVAAPCRLVSRFGGYMRTKLRGKVE